MKVLCAAIGSLVLLMLVYSLLELALPGGRLAPYVRLLMVLSLLVTAVELAGGPAAAAEWPSADRSVRAERQQQGEEYARQGAQLAADLTAQASAEYGVQLSEQIRSLVLALPNVSEARVQTEIGADGMPAAVEIVFTAAEGSAVDSEEVRDLICGVYGLSAGQVNCREAEHE